MCRHGQEMRAREQKIRGYEDEKGAKIQKREAEAVDSPTSAASAEPSYYTSIQNVRLSLFKRSNNLTYPPLGNLLHRSRSH